MIAALIASLAVSIGCVMAYLTFSIFCLTLSGTMPFTNPAIIPAAYWTIIPGSFISTCIITRDNFDIASWISGRCSIMYLDNLPTNSPSFSPIAPEFSSSHVPILLITCPIDSSTAGKFSTMPFTSCKISSPPFSIIFGSESESFPSHSSIICGKVSASCGTYVLIPSTSPSIRIFPCSAICGIAVSKNVPIAPGKDFIILPIAGIRLSNRNVQAASTKVFIASFTDCSWPPKTSSPIKFCAAAFMELKDPDKVCSASFAVVPVISSSP